MGDPSTLILFLIAALALLLIPGPVVLYTIARTLDQGRQAGFASVLAAGIGNSCHVLAATLGFSALLASSALAFDVVKYAGAAYLIYLGVRTLTSRHEYVLLAASAGAWLKQNRIFVQSQRYFAGVVYLALGVTTALSGSRQSK